MAIEVQCSCGKRLKAQPSLAGKRVRCPACKSPVDIPDSRQTDVAELSVQPTTADDDVWDSLPQVAEQPLAPQDDVMTTARSSTADQLLAKASAEKLEQSEDLDSWSTRKIGSGIAMVVGALVWLTIGLVVGRIHLIPMVLLVVGIVALINGVGYKLQRKS